MSAFPIEAMIAAAERVNDVVSPQLDAVHHGDRYRFAEERPDCFMNVTLSARDFPDPAPTRQTVAERAKGHFEGMLQRRLFEPVPGRVFLLYELDTGEHRQLGLVAAVPVSAATEGRIIGHEGTIDDRVEDLVRFFRVARMASSPVSLGFRADQGHLQLMEELASGEPARDFEGMDGVRQRLWIVSEPTDIRRVEVALSRVGPMYITDGHHRVAAARSREASGPGWILAVLFPAAHLVAVEYNRVIRVERKADVEEVTCRLRPDWEVSPIGMAGRVGARPRSRGEISMLLDGTWYRLTYVGRRPLDSVAGLDVSLLHDLILGPVFGISPQDHRLSYATGGESLAGLEEQVAEYRGGVGFAMYPAGIEEVMAVADAGRLMPPKSTWFTPKPRSGLFVVRWGRSAMTDGSRATVDTYQP